MDLDDGRRNATANTSDTVDQLLVGLRGDFQRADGGAVTADAEGHRGGTGPGSGRERDGSAEEHGHGDACGERGAGGGHAVGEQRGATGQDQHGPMGGRRRPSSSGRPAMAVR
ncbi:hypothetical protein [Streptomyces sp. NPDC060243]|uniref:hypothetical protein n=1 Tax=Streptomyces sp. NPDC060243 TaxID=3347081 RepID=UPI003661FA8F